VAEDILRRLYQGREEARRIGDASATTIRFAATHSLSFNFFPGWLRSIEVGCHALNTRLDTSQFNECIQLLLRGECNFLISYTHPAIQMHLPKEHFTSKVVLRDRLVPVTLPDSEGRPVDLLPGSEDEPVHYLAYSETSAVGRVVENLLVHRAGARASQARLRLAHGRRAEGDELGRGGEPPGCPKATSGRSSRAACSSAQATRGGRRRSTCA
jgi:LysR family transcriptional regulator, hypochlorite-specific transcription factor HypT